MHVTCIFAIVCDIKLMIDDDDDDDADDDDVDADGDAAAIAGI